MVNVKSFYFMSRKEVEKIAMKYLILDMSIGCYSSLDEIEQELTSAPIDDIIKYCIECCELEIMEV